MKILIRLITVIFSLSIILVAYGDKVAIDENAYTIHQGVEGKNLGSRGNDLFLTGDVGWDARKWEVRKSEYVVIKARRGNDVVYADWTMRTMLKASASPEEWGAWGCDANKQTCLVREQKSTEQWRNHGVAALMGTGSDTFHGTPYKDLAYTGSSPSKGQDILYGYGGDDVLIANGRGKRAELHGGAGTDLLWNQRRGGVVQHFPGVADRDMIITGPGKDVIHLDDEGGASSIGGIMGSIYVFGFDPAKDTLANAGEFAYHAKVKPCYDNNGRPKFNVTLPSVTLFGKRFTLARSAVEGYEYTTSTWRRDDGRGIIVNWIPWKGQEMVTSVTHE